MDRAQLKEEARTTLKGKMIPFVLAFVVFLCAELVIIAPFTASIIFSGNPDSTPNSFIVSFIISYLLILAFMIVAFPMYLMTFIKGITKAAELPESEKFTFKGFWSGLKGSSCGIGNFWWTFLWTYLWELLCLLPVIILVLVAIACGIEETENYYFLVGLVAIIGYFGAIFAVINRSIAYSMNWFVLAKRPATGAVEAMNISKKITKGHKRELFVLNLSFIGWFILSMFTCGLLLLWVMPYFFMTQYYAFRYLVEECKK